MREGWTYKKLGEICEIICGQDYKKVESPDGKYPIYGTGGIMGYANDFKCPAYSVIVGRKGNINNPIYVEENFWNVDTAFGIVPSKACLASKFFFYFCQNYDFSKHNVAVTIPSLRRIDLLKIPIPVPPLSEQQRIVNELDLLSSIIEKKKAQLKENDALAQSIFYDMFGDPVKGTKFKRSTIGCVITNIKYGTGTPPTFSDTGYCFIRATNIKNGHIDNNDMRFINSNEALKIEKCKLSLNDLIIVRSGVNAGDACNISSDYVGHYAGYDIIITANTDLIDTIFLNGILNNDNYVKMVIKPLTRRAAQPHLNAQQVQGMNIPLPPLSLQHSFASKIEAIERQKALIQQSIIEAETLFNSRMDYWFS